MADETNPKDRIGIKKPQVHLVPPAAVLHMAKAFEDGAKKYGPYNWRDKKVRATVYLSAALRHLYEYLDGDTYARDSGHHHLAHLLACAAILLDAEETGNLIDDRPPKGAAGDMIERLTLKDDAAASPQKESSPPWAGCVEAKGQSFDRSPYVEVYQKTTSELGIDPYKMWLQNQPQQAEPEQYQTSGYRVQKRLDD